VGNQKSGEGEHLKTFRTRDAEIAEKPFFFVFLRVTSWMEKTPCDFVDGFALEHGVDAVSQSFVESAADIDAVRSAAAACGRHPFIIAKIERPGLWAT